VQPLFRSVTMAIVPKTRSRQLRDRYPWRQMLLSLLKTTRTTGHRPVDLDLSSWSSNGTGTRPLPTTQRDRASTQTGSNPFLVLSRSDLHRRRPGFRSLRVLKRRRRQRIGCCCCCQHPESISCPTWPPVRRRRCATACGHGQSQAEYRFRTQPMSVCCPCSPCRPHHYQQQHQQRD